MKHLLWIQTFCLGSMLVEDSQQDHTWLGNISMWGGRAWLVTIFFRAPTLRRSMKGFYLELKPLKNCLAETKKVLKKSCLEELLSNHPKIKNPWSFFILSMLLGASKMPSWQPLQKNPQPKVCGWMIRQKAISQQCLSGWNCCRGRCHTQTRQQSWEWKRPILPFRLAGTLRLLSQDFFWQDLFRWCDSFHGCIFKRLMHQERVVASWKQTVHSYL